jgi:hypothetical protein
MRRIDLKESHLRLLDFSNQLGPLTFLGWRKLISTRLAIGLADQGFLSITSRDAIIETKRSAATVPKEWRLPACNGMARASVQATSLTGKYVFCSSLKIWSN